MTTILAFLPPASSRNRLRTVSGSEPPPTMTSAPLADCAGAGAGRRGSAAHRTDGRDAASMAASKPGVRRPGRATRTKSGQVGSARSRTNNLRGCGEENILAHWGLEEEAPRLDE